MKKSAALLVSAAAAATMAVGSLHAAGAAAPIRSDSADALDAPSQWSCAKIEHEYRDFLKTGQPDTSWRFAGKTYVDVATGRQYDWQDWMRWSNRAGCNFADRAQPTGGVEAGLGFGQGVGQVGVLPGVGGGLASGLVSVAVAGLGAGLVAAGESAGPASPG